MSEVKVNKISPRSGTDVTLGDSGDTFTIPSGATLTNSGTATGFASIAWQTVVTASTLTAVAGRGYPINTTSNACTVTLPASASAGDTLIFTDYARNFGTNKLTINQNSLNYQGSSSVNPVYSTDGESIHIVYVDATKGWIPTYDAAVANKTPPYDIEWLVVGGGGGGGTGANAPYNRAGGAGGAGGYRNSYETTGGGGTESNTELDGLSSGVVLTIDVGGGGAGGSGASAVGTIGQESSIKGTAIDITSDGGGAGAYNGQTGGVGGSGGGGGALNGTTSGGAGTTNQGFAGGGGGSNAGGGGGGASEVGETESGGTAAGGDGVSASITGSAITRAGGGGGYRGGSQAGGAGGGGAGSGANGSPASTAGTANTGGGGGSSENEGANPNGAAGGSGVIILRIPTPHYSGTSSGAETPTTDGAFTILTFNGDGTYTT